LKNGIASLAYVRQSIRKSELAKKEGWMAGSSPAMTGNA
jgi:hypothetical protein